MNDLQMVASLLSAQSCLAEDTETAAQLNIAANRVVTISRVHRRLVYVATMVAATMINIPRMRPLGLPSCRAIQKSVKPPTTARVIAIPIMKLLAATNVIPICPNLRDFSRVRSWRRSRLSQIGCAKSRMGADDQRRHDPIDTQEHGQGLAALRHAVLTIGILRSEHSLHPGGFHRLNSRRAHHQSLQNQRLATVPACSRRGKEARRIRPLSVVAAAIVLEMVPYFRMLVCSNSSRWSSSSVSTTSS
jgi:hypothetical protein